MGLVGHFLEVGRERESGLTPLSFGHLLHPTALRRHAKQMRVTADTAAEENVLSIRTPGGFPWTKVPAVREIGHLTAFGRHEEKIDGSPMILSCVDDEVETLHPTKNDRVSIRRPRGCAVVIAVFREASNGALEIHRPKIRLLIGMLVSLVGIGNEGERVTIRTPYSSLDVHAKLCQLFRLSPARDTI